MNFTKTTDNHTCDCFEEAFENTTEKFVRKVSRTASLKERDFKSHFERGKIAEDEHDCDEVCGLRGLSFEIWNSESSEPLMKKYLTTAAISPQYKKNLCVIFFRSDSGLVKYTPNQVEYNEFHYDFYKNDSFTIENLLLAEMIPLEIS